MSSDEGRDRATAESETVYLELSDDTSQKFYEVTVSGAVVTIRYGRIGSDGQTSSKTYATAEKAQAEATKKLNEKLRKGYTRQTETTPEESPPEASPSETAATAAPPLPDTLTLKCLGAVEGPRWLDGKTAPGTVALAPVTTGGYTGTRWQVVPLEPGIIALKCLGHIDGPRWLDGKTTTGNVGLAPTTEGDYTGTRWQVVPLEPNIIALKCLGHIEGPRWLDGKTTTGNVGLAPTTEGDYTGTRWEIHAIAPPPAAPSTAPPPATVAPPAPAAPPPPDLPAPSLSLLNISPFAPPRVAHDQLRQLKYPLGFNFRENRYCSLQMPLARSLVGLEIVGTFNNLGNSSLTLTLSAQNETAYSLWFRPREGHMTQQSTGHQQRGGLPEGLASGQVFQLVVAIAANNDFVLYVNNQPFSYRPPAPLTAPIDQVTLNYDTTGIQLKLFRVLEPRGKAPPQSTKKADKPGAIAAPSPASPPQSPPPTAVEMPEFLDHLPSHFEPLRPLLEANLVPYIQFTATEAKSAGTKNRSSGWCDDPLDLRQSKIGGYPYLPKGTPYPADYHTGQLMMFLMQINCADLPVVEQLNLPNQGLLQFFVGLNVPLCELSPEQHRVIYYPEVADDNNDLITDFSFLAESASALEWYDDVFALSFVPKQDLFWDARRSLGPLLEVPAALQALSAEFDDWIADYEDRCIYNGQGQGGRKNKLGGYPELHSTVAETIEGARGRLLLELQHEFNCDDNFYFYIEDAALADENFNSIESYFLRN